MPKIFKDVLKYGIILAIMVWLLYSTFMDIPQAALEAGQSRFDFILSYWNKADKTLLLLSGLAALLSHVLRAMRWKLVLEPLGYRNISTFNATNAVLNGYFINLFIPRGGEISRPIALKNTDGVPVNVGVGTVVTERIIDLLFLVVCIGSVFVFQAEVILNLLQDAMVFLKSTEQSNQAGIPKIVWLLLIGGFGLIGVLVLFKLKKDLFLGLKNKALEFLGGMKAGLLSIFKLEQKILFVTYSLLIWGLYYVMLYLVFIAFVETEHISVSDALTIFVVGGIAMALPMPGGAGAYHKMVSFALINLCAVAAAPAIAIVTVFHGFQTLVVIIVGGMSVYFISKNTQKNANQE